MNFKNYNIMVVAMAFLLFFAACTTATTNQETQESASHDDGTNDNMMEENKGMDKDTDSSSDMDKGMDDSEKMMETPSWFSIELTDVNSGEVFTLNDYKGEPIVLESFAVWCPTCTKQQNILKEQKASGVNDIVHLSLDLDPNEDESKVKQHAISNGFDWFYVVSPSEMTQALVAEFGPGIASAPSVPVVVICKDQTFTMMGRGIKSAEDINEELAKCSA